MGGYISPSNHKEFGHLQIIVSNSNRTILKSTKLSVLKSVLDGLLCIAVVSGVHQPCSSCTPRFISAPWSNSNLASSEFLSNTACMRRVMTGIVVQWWSSTGKYYRLDRATDLTAMPLFDQVVTARVAAILPMNTVTDTTATGDGPYFYRVAIVP
jgi:hypothetical protein